MKIAFNQGLSRVHDAMEGLVLSYQDNYKQVYKDYSFTVSKNAAEALGFIQDHVDFAIPCRELFFSRDREAAVSFARSRFIPEDITVDAFADHLAELTDEQARLIMLINLNDAAKQSLDHEVLVRLSRGEGDVVAFIRQITLPPAVKWEAMEFFDDTRGAMKAFVGLVKRYLPVYKQVLDTYKNAIEGFETYVSQGVGADGKRFLNRVVRDAIELESENISVGILFFRSRSLTCVTIDDKLRVFIGTEYEDTVKQALGGEDISMLIFKNLADKTRFQILNLLKSGDLYGQEIAEKVGITLATVSYHMSFLLAANLVRLEKIGQKGYYTLQKQALKRCIAYLDTTFGLSEAKGDE